jgi:glyoxylase-like metal-dependent hydrolase (beta-lactamase superfamily II)
MTIHSINSGTFKLDGGAMFGVVPKQLWNKADLSDPNNLCTWAMRCLLVEDGKRLILIDTGMGNKQEKKFNSYYSPQNVELVKQIRQKGYHENQVTDVILSHLHFDHAGGAVCWNSTKTDFELTFPNARYWTHSQHWQSAINPNAKEKATFLKENINLLWESGHLNFLNEIDFDHKSFNFRFCYGHTEAMILPEITLKNQKIIFAADLIPSIHHITPTWVMAYDVNPLLSIDEKQLLLNDLVNNEAILCFDHDVDYEACTLVQTDKGFGVLNRGGLNSFV